jgi:hypothetical protein
MPKGASDRTDWDFRGDPACALSLLLGRRGNGGGASGNGEAGGGPAWPACYFQRVSGWRFTSSGFTSKPQDCMR